MNLLKNKFVFLWLPVILYAGIIFYFSSIVQLDFPVSFPLMDNLLHLGEYALFGILLARAIKRSYQVRDIKKLCILVVAIAFVYGLSDEFHQAFVPGRSVSFFDVLSDAVGALLGAIIYR